MSFNSPEWTKSLSVSIRMDKVKKLKRKCAAWCQKIVRKCNGHLKLHFQVCVRGFKHVHCQKHQWGKVNFPEVNLIALKKSIMPPDHMWSIHLVLHWQYRQKKYDSKILHCCYLPVSSRNPALHTDACILQQYVPGLGEGYSWICAKLILLDFIGSCTCTLHNELNLNC